MTTKAKYLHGPSSQCHFPLISCLFGVFYFSLACRFYDFVFVRVSVPVMPTQARFSLSLFLTLSVLVYYCYMY